jgi:hypothetical protein
VDFNLSYNLPSAQIMGTLIKEADAAAAMGGSEEGSFLLMVTPPSPDKIMGMFCKLLQPNLPQRFDEHQSIHCVYIVVLQCAISCSLWIGRAQ